MIACCDTFTELDALVGDGDLGISIKKAGEAVLVALPNYPLLDMASTLRELATTLQDTLGGSIGPFCTVFFLNLAESLKKFPNDWARGVKEGTEAIMRLGGAKVGDRTLLDALVPACEALQSQLESGHSIREALESAVVAAETVSKMLCSNRVREHRRLPHLLHERGGQFS